MAVNNGTLDESRVDDMVRRIMTPYFFLKQNEYPPIDGYDPILSSSNTSAYQYPFTLGPSNVDVRENHASLIRQLGAAGIVLLKNTNNTLPLQSPGTIGVFGNDAGDVVDGLYFSGAPFAQPQGYGRW
jgi:beta-glucosidase